MVILKHKAHTEGTAGNIQHIIDDLDMGEIAAGKHRYGQTPNAEYAPEGKPVVLR